VSRPLGTDLSSLPRIAGSWSFLYVEQARIEKGDDGVVLQGSRGRISIPSAPLATLLAGPGTTITHAAVTALARSGCSIVWCGSTGVRFYASGHPDSRRAANLHWQARAWADPAAHLEVVKRLYRMRFAAPVSDHLTLEQLRGLEGVRVRDAYAAASAASGVPWKGRSWKRDAWGDADPVNRALSVANTCLYGLCHAAIAATGFSPALGFIHTGKALSFVYDIADLYKIDLSVPVAFAAAREGDREIESRTRRACREWLTGHRVLERIVPDMQRALGITPERVRTESLAVGDEAVEPAALWDPGGTDSPGGRNWATDAPPGNSEPETS